ncbi:MAG TPA: aldehyde dehydrogenase family protein [Solirubrobacteraceae bacterium]|nr:aldehyde dehydrogenase family protein [Solirubrobacteraceae bacterium]
MEIGNVIGAAALLIGGEECGSDDLLEVHNPHDGSLVGIAPAADGGQAQAAVAAAEAAWRVWSALPVGQRVEQVLGALAGLEADADERAALLVREHGKVLAEAQIEMRVFVARFHQAAALARNLDSPERIPGPPFETTVVHVPQGVVTIIVPFNWPLAILAAALPYALMAGNTVIVKAPPSAPLAMLATLRHLTRALPAGVLNVVSGRDDVLGPVLVGDPRIRHVCFTGSVTAGSRIMQMAAPNITNVTLELGGNDAAIVLDDARLDGAAFARLATAAFRTTGQVCMAIKRLYVPRTRFDEVVGGMRAALEGTRVGSGLDPEVTMGPLHSARQRDYVAELCDEALHSGAEVLELGALLRADPDVGHHMLPRLVLDPEPGLRIVTEEQFGPALPIIAYESEAAAIEQANDNWAGLCSSVWSEDPERAMAVGRQLRTGVTFFNNHNAVAVDERAPFGGMRQSGIGREMGREGLHTFTETHVLSVPA